MTSSWNMWVSRGFWKVRILCGTLWKQLYKSQRIAFHVLVNNSIYVPINETIYKEKITCTIIKDTIITCFPWFILYNALLHNIDIIYIWFYSERPRGTGFRSVNPTERWRENPARALARAGFSQHLECGIHRSESSPSGSFALIPHPVARWAKTTP